MQPPSQTSRPDSKYKWHFWKKDSTPAKPFVPVKPPAEPRSETYPAITQRDRIALDPKLLDAPSAAGGPVARPDTKVTTKVAGHLDWQARFDGATGDKLTPKAVTERADAASHADNAQDLLNLYAWTELLIDRSDERLPTVQKGLLASACQQFIQIDGGAATTRLALQAHTLVYRTLLARCAIDEDAASGSALIEGSPDKAFDAYMSLSALSKASSYRYWLAASVIHRWLQPTDVEAEFRWPRWTSERSEPLRNWLKDLPAKEKSAVFAKLAGRLATQHPNDLGVILNLACSHLATPRACMNDIICRAPDLSLTQLRVGVWTCAKATLATLEGELAGVLKGLGSQARSLDSASTHHAAAAVHAVVLAKPQDDRSAAWQVLLDRLPSDDASQQIALVAAFAGPLQAAARTGLAVDKAHACIAGIEQGLALAAQPDLLLQASSRIDLDSPARLALADVLLLPIADAAHQTDFSAEGLAAIAEVAAGDLLAHYARTVPTVLESEQVLSAVHQSLLRRMAASGANEPVMELYASIRRLQPKDATGHWKMLARDLADAERLGIGAGTAAALQALQTTLVAVPPSATSSTTR